LNLPFPSWSDYFAAAEGRPLRPFYDELAPHLPPGGLAIDLGCGTGPGTFFLLEHGLDVVAQDGEGEAIDALAKKLEERPEFSQRVALIHASFGDLALPEATYDVALAVFSIFFAPPAEFERLWPRIVGTIRPNGIFAGQLLGAEDEWASFGLARHRREEIDRLLEPFDRLHFEEVRRPGKDVFGRDKHWHLFHIVARKR
jgi:tellurite methyltransferase